MSYSELTKQFIKDNKWKEIGRWYSRVCYEHKGDASLVLKYAKDVEWILANLVERYISRMLMVTWYKEKLVALTHSVSNDWKWIIQERAEPVEEERKRSIRKWLGRDAKVSNFWKIGSDIVKVDYWQTNPLYNSLVQDWYIVVDHMHFVF